MYSTMIIVIIAYLGTLYHVCHFHFRIIALSHCFILILSSSKLYPSLLCLEHLKILYRIIIKLMLCSWIRLVFKKRNLFLPLIE